MAALSASPSEDYASMMQSRKHCLALSAQARSPLQPLLPGKPENDGIRCAMLSVAIWKRRAMPPTGLSGNTMPPTPRTGWWRVSLKRAGTGRSRTRRRSRARSPCMMRRRPHPLLIQLRSAFWPRTSKRSGMREAIGADDAALGMYELARRLDAKPSLRELGMPSTGIDQAADLAVTNAYWNPRALERAPVRELIACAWAGEPPV